MKNFKIKVIISSVILLVMVAYASYATITDPIIKLGNEVITGNISSKNVVFTANGTGISDITVPYEKMSAYEDNDVEVKSVANATSVITMSIDSDKYDYFRCDYELVWAWEETDDANSKYIKTTCDNAQPEYTIDIYCGNITSNYKSTATAKVVGLQLPDYNQSSNTTVIFSTKGNPTYAVGSNNNDYKCYIETNFYNIKSCDQSALKGKTFRGRVKVQNVTCTRGSSTS